MASYEQSPNPQAFSFQPYELPYNQIMQTVAAKTQYFLQGANQLKSAYAQAAGLNLSLDQNREALHNFTDQANDQVNKAAKSDLSQADNVQSAMNIFKPLYDGTSDLSQQIMGDHAVTTQAQQIMSQYDEAKTKNNGKEYSPTNEQYSLQAYNNFVKNNDPTKWKDAYQGLKQYTPYYDYHKELMDNIKNCHGSSTTTTGVNGMYITSGTTSGVDANQMAGCLGSNLSSQAEGQISIEGSVRYGQNYKALADDYLPVAQQNRNVILSDKAQLAVRLADPKISPEIRQDIQQQMKQYDDQVANIDAGTSAIQKGDYSYIKNNYDQLAAATYRGQKIASMAGAFAHVDRIQEIKADPVQMMYARFREDSNLLTQKEGFDERMQDRKENFEFRLKELELNGETGAITPMTPTVNPDGSASYTQADFEKARAKTNADLQTNEEALHQHLITSPVTKGVLEGDPVNNPVIYANSKKAILNDAGMVARDPWLAAWKAKDDQLQLDKNIQLSTEHSIYMSKPATDARNQVANVVASVNKGDNVFLRPKDQQYYPGTPSLQVSSEDIKNLLLGNAVRGMTLGKTQEYTGAIGGGMTGGGGGSLNTQNVIRMPNGQEMVIGGGYLSDMITQRDGKLSDLNKRIDNLYNQHYVSNPVWGNLSNYNGPEARQVRSQLQNVLNGVGTPVEDKDIKLLSTDWKNTVRFTIPPDSKGNFPDATQLVANGGAAGFTNIQAVPGTKGVYEASGVKQFDRTNDVALAQKMQTFAENLQNVAAQSGNRFPRTPMLTDYHGINITAVQDPNGQLIYELQDASNPGRINYATSPTQLTSMLQQLK